MAGAANLWQRARFVAALVLRLASRALAQGGPRPRSPVPIDDPEPVIEALQTGDLARLDQMEQTLLHGDHRPGLPWVFVALETGSLATITWFLAKGASPTAPDGAGRLPLEVVIQRAAASDDLDDHLPDCPAMAQALIAAGADPKALTVQGQSLLALARAAGLHLDAG